MSYARFGCDDSDVYVFATCQGGLECCGCFLSGVSGPSPRFDTSGEMIAHLDAHRAAGDTVPDYTYEEILKDYPELIAVIEADD
jgi:hypothetical protein